MNGLLLFKKLSAPRGHFLHRRRHQPFHKGYHELHRIADYITVIAIVKFLETFVCYFKNNLPLFMLQFVLNVVFIRFPRR